MTLPQPLLKLDQLRRHRAGRPAVERLSLALDRGEILGLLGVNGAGKSTTLSMIAGALRPDSGTIELGGKNFLEMPELAQKAIGWLPERAPLWQELTVHEHLRTHAQLRGLRSAALTQACDAVIQRLELTPLLRRLAGVLSQGQRQRLGLACALIHSPDVLVLDEPANALDPVQVASLRKVIREEAARGAAVILSTHLLAEVTAICTRVAILHEGHLRHDGAVPAGDHTALEQTFFDIAMHGAGAQAA
ncbi:MULTISPECIES: ABC transporter ATP-binding protein [Dyella]|uniref:ABC transporter ATP-binding protein n=2 Tax=Dyella TaxID=231454 RepID=A0A4R0YQF5_9GAMM|nr:MULTISPECIES: ABC transporter ATP-binding protein [Dyella]TBR36603.1 ABC transporter ATP-binding protein [Dyella terrae]TCI08305.1 ABC transporter ATP-binding protein [Dyella soli]